MDDDKIFGLSDLSFLLLNWKSLVIFFGVIVVVLVIVIFIVMVVVYFGKL